MPRPGFETVTIKDDVDDLLEQIREGLPVRLSRGEVVHLALLALQKERDPMRLLKGKK